MIYIKLYEVLKDIRDLRNELDIIISVQMFSVLFNKPNGRGQALAPQDISDMIGTYMERHGVGFARAGNLGDPAYPVAGGSHGNKIVS